MEKVVYALHQNNVKSIVLLIDLLFISTHTHKNLVHYFGQNIVLSAKTKVCIRKPMARCERINFVY